MVLESEKAPLQKAFSSTIHWVALRRMSAKQPREIAFLDTIEKYSSNSLHRLSEAKTKRELKKLRDRADKLQAAVIFYVQRQLR